VKDNVMGLEQIKVELVDHMGDDLSTVNSARVSFDKESGYEECNEDGCHLHNKDSKLIKYLADHKHFTPFRHNAIQIRCTAPIFLARQLGKHQAGLSWNEVSRRYVDTPPEFYTPDEWRGRPTGSIKQGSSGVVTFISDIEGKDMHRVSELYDDYINKSIDFYSLLLDEGNISPEMARMVLPQSMQTTWVWSGNLLAFNHVYKERIAEGAQLEAKHFAKELGVILEQLFPVSFKALKGEL
jgi:thymidylate synthase (FAD)